MKYNSSLVNQSQIDKDIKNKGFILFDTMVKEHGWHIIHNEMNRICYTKFGHETDLFDIRILEKTIEVSVPLRNSKYQFITSFTDYFMANEYLESKLIDFMD
jgi:hypothetical protein